MRSIIDESDLLEVVGEAENGQDTIQLFEESDPDLVILDISMPKLDGIEAAREIQKKAGTRIVILSGKRPYDAEQVRFYGSSGGKNWPPR